MSTYWEPGQPAPDRTAAPAATVPPQQKESTKQNLSKSVLSMKFMSRKRDAAQSEVEEKAKRAKIQEDGWAVQPPAAAQTSGRFQREQSSIYSALPGRRSFGGFNAIVEKYYANAVGLSAPGELASNAAETTEKDMTEHYESLVGLPRGPNQGRAPPRPPKNSAIAKKSSKGVRRS